MSTLLYFLHYFSKERQFLLSVSVYFSDNKRKTSSTRKATSKGKYTVMGANSLPKERSTFKKICSKENTFVSERVEPK